MKKLNITPDEFRSVSGKMVACRAAEKLGISESNFYHLAQRFSISTAFVKQRWSETEITLLLRLRAAGESKKSIGRRMNRSEGAVKSKLRHMRLAEEMDMKRGAQ